MNVTVCYDNNRVIILTEVDNTVEFWARVSVTDTVIEYRALAYYHGEGVYGAVLSAIDEHDRARSHQELHLFDESEKAIDCAEKFVTESRKFIG